MLDHDSVLQIACYQHLYFRCGLNGQIVSYSSHPLNVRGIDVMSMLLVGPSSQSLLSTLFYHGIYEPWVLIINELWHKISSGDCSFLLVAVLLVLIVTVMRFLYKLCSDRITIFRLRDKHCYVPNFTALSYIRASCQNYQGLYVRRFQPQKRV